MELSSPKIKAFTTSAGISFWFFLISNGIGIFSIELFLAFIIGIFITMQILSFKIIKLLDILTIFNTKIFLSILFITTVSIYGILFKILKIDLLRLKKQSNSYWLDNKNIRHSNISKQY